MTSERPDFVQLGAEWSLVTRSFNGRPVATLENTGRSSPDQWLGGEP